MNAWVNSISISEGRSTRISDSEAESACKGHSTGRKEERTRASKTGKTRREEVRGRELSSVELGGEER
jgi:hypothetical protein